MAFKSSLVFTRSSLPLVCLGAVLLILQELRLHNFIVKNYHREAQYDVDVVAPSFAAKKISRISTQVERHNDIVTSILWEDMAPSQQKEAYGIVLPYLKNLATLINKRINQRKGKWKLNSFSWSCKAIEIGGGWSGHYLCGDMLDKLNNSCQFFSFGIANSYSFEKALSDNYNCHGFSGDPTVSHPSNIYTNVTFHQIGAKLLTPNEEQRNGKDGPWWIANVPLLKKALGVDHLDVLKMDCEGCEYGLAKDIIRDDPTFFESIDQFALETHTAREWLNSTETLYYYGLLLKLLKNAGFRLHDVRAASCAPEHTKTGCFEDARFLCNNPNRCQSYLFAKT